MKIETVKGFNDYTGEEAERRTQIKKIIEETFLKYGFEAAETPVIEYEEFVKGDNEKDEAVSDIFKLEDKGKRKLALRYELTFPLKRIAKNKKLPYKRYQIGEVFRDEPVSSNRFRQITQCDADVIGSSIRDEAEILALTKEIFDRLGIKVEIYIGNRKLLNEILDEQGVKEKEEIIREIDKLDKLSESEIKKNLKKYNVEKILGIFKKPESYFEKYKSYKEVLELKKYCNYYGVKINFQPSLARGLSYYNGTVFEIKSQGVKETITAGGSYLINNIQSTGVSLGIDRVSKLARLKKDDNKALVISLNQDKQAIKFAQKLRSQGKNTTILYGKISKALEYANAYRIKEVYILGEKEVKQKKVKFRDMESGKERLISL